MFGTATNPATAYATVAVQTGVAAASPLQLIVMLYDGASLAIASAAEQIRQGDVVGKGKSIAKAIDIIANGLKVSLDREVGGELAGRLAALYDYMVNRLLHANLHNDDAALKEVSGLLAELKGAWEEIANDPAVLSRNGAVA